MGKIILFDDETATLDQFRQLFIDFEITNELITCSSLEDYRDKIKNNSTELRALIVDLAKDKEETIKGDYEITSDLEKNFSQYRVPIFICSGNIKTYDGFLNKGTVFRMDKDRNSMRRICEIIKQFEVSGFMEIFAQNGILEQKLISELHEVFTNQFKEDEINKIIESINKSDSKFNSKRIEEIFTRISIRALLNKFLSHPIDAVEIDPITVNAIEHYYRREDSRKFWTGDIFKNNNDGKYVMVLNPRCDIQNNTSSKVLLCEILEEKWPSKGKDYKNFLTNNILSKRHRHIPKTVFFNGGKVDYSTVFTIENVIFIDDYSYTITLSDDFTNEIVSKYCSYMLRTGIEEINIEEAMGYLNG